MATILIVTTGLTGIVNASFELARRLREDGHDITLGACRPVGEKVEAQGFDFVEFPFISTDPAPTLPESAGKLKRVYLRWRDRKARRAAALEAYRPHAFRQAIGRLQPDLILIDIELHAYIFAAYAMGKNFALLSQWYSTWRRPGLPYLLTDVIPGEGEGGTVAAVSAHWETVKRQRRRMFAKMNFLSSGADRRSTLLALARQYDFPLETIQKNWWPGVFTYARWPAISLTPFEMEFPHEPRPNLYYAGPMVLADRKEAAGVSHEGRGLETIIRESQQANRRIILATVSTLHAGDTAFLRRLCEAVSTRPDWTLLLGLGGKIDPVVLGDRSGNVHTFVYVPQLQALRAADLSINHAGIHTIHECIHFGVPQLIYSGGRSDQPGCAARAHYHGIGLRADKETDTVEDIQEKIDRVLTDESFKMATERMRKQCSAYRTDRIVESLISSLLDPDAEGASNKERK